MPIKSDEMENLGINIQTFIRLAGLAQIVLVMGSFAIPKVLDWPNQLKTVPPLIRQMFWVYAAYILTINLCFGLVSTFVSAELVNHSTLAVLVNGFIALYWISRMVVQFFVLDHSNFPKGPWHKVAEMTLTLLFICLATIYSTAFYLNLK